MGPSVFLSISTTLLFLFISLFLHISVTSTSPSSSKRPPLCHDDEMSALLQFKKGFIIDVQASLHGDPLAYPKVESWKLVGEESNYTDCCSWDGVECDDASGHVVGLDLSSSWLHGSINSSNSLFHLLHLRKLNLAFNDFNNSLVPSSFGHLSKLTYLNLSDSFFSGQIASNISDLWQLSSLDLSFNDQLFFVKSDFRKLVQNFTNLEVLHLNLVDISSPLPDILSNASSLTSLRLKKCGLHGKFPAGILHLPKLENISLSYNPNLVGHLPEFHFSSPLRTLSLGFTSFSGELPVSIGNLNSLTYLNLQRCNFLGKFPSSLENLTQLYVLSLSRNPFSSLSTSSLSWIGQLSKLTTLDLQYTNLYGEIPPFIANLTQLYCLFLHQNQLSGPISSWLMNLTRLTQLDLSANRLQGRLLSTYSNITVRKFSMLGLGSCNLNVLPDFLRRQDKLEVLELPNNNIHGQIPRWLLNISAHALEIIDLSDNFLTGFEENPVVFQWSKVRQIDLRYNMLQASLPLPPPSIEVYAIGGNRITGELSSWFCSLTSLFVLHVQDNNLSGTLPSCLGHSITNMEMLDLGRNNFHGIILQNFSKTCTLRMIALNKNQLEGKVPRTLASCTMLEFLNLGNNQINDVFPFWLGRLPNLQVLVLRSNQFYGALTGHKTETYFKKLHIVDLSQNNLSGELPASYFLNWIGMKEVEVNQPTYMQSIRSIQLLTKTTFNISSMYTMSIRNKGVELNYTKILNYFAAIDFSCNRFEGEIPQVIGNLKGLQLLNLSNNNLNGRIPSSLGNLTKLESLDLSQNNLIGEIPLQLIQLNFLAVFNVSHNHLTGPIPLGKQFDTFQIDSYRGNPGLCGKILPRKCANSEALPPTPSRKEDDQGSSSSLEFGWKPVAIGYGSGLIFGLLIGHIVAIRKYDWPVKTFRIRPQRMKRGRGREGRRIN